MTAAGTRPTDKRKTGPATTADHDDGATHHYESGRYTAPTAKYAGESPKWVPILMLALFVVGGLLIMARYLSGTRRSRWSSAWPASSAASTPPPSGDRRGPFPNNPPPVVELRWLVEADPQPLEEVLER